MCTKRRILHAALQITALCIGLPACSAETPSTALQELPGVVWEVRFGEPGRETGPEVLAVSPSLETLWVAGNSRHQRDSQPWLRKLDKSGRVSDSVGLAELLGGDSESSLSSLRFTGALALSDEFVVLVTVFNAETPILIALDAAGTVRYRTEVFGGEAGNVYALKPWGQDRIAVLGYKRIGESLHAAFVEVDKAGTVARQRVVSDRKATAFNYALAGRGGEVIFVGQAFDFADDSAKVWIVRMSEADEILEERFLAGTVYAVAAGDDGRFAVCLAVISDEAQEAHVAEYDRNLKELWRTTVHHSRRREGLFSCKIASTQQGGYVAMGQSFDRGPSVAAIRLNRGGEIAWRFVEPTSETSYTWHLIPRDLDSRGDSLFMLTELLLPPGSGSPSTLAGVVHFRITR